MYNVKVIIRSSLKKLTDIVKDRFDPVSELNLKIKFKINQNYIISLEKVTLWKMHLSKFYVWKLICSDLNLRSFDTIVLSDLKIKEKKLQMSPDEKRRTKKKK